MPQRPIRATYSNSRDDDSELIEERAPTPLKSASEPGSPDLASTESSSASDDGDDQSPARECEDARQSAEAATLKKTGWLLLTSSARNLSNVLKHIGVTGLNVSQLYNLRLPTGTRPLAFILLYKWAPDRGDRIDWNPERMRNPDAQPGGEDHNALISFMEDDSLHIRRHDVLFCGQTMDNAAATQALMLALLNIPERGIPSSTGSSFAKPTSLSERFDVGDKIRLLKAFMRPMDPTLRAAAVCSSAAVREAHNNAAHEQLNGHPHLLDEDGKVRTSMLADELWMYSVYVPARGGSMCYEMEGMSDGARVLAHCSPSDPSEWISIVFEHIDERISVFRQHNSQFLLFTLAPNHAKTAKNEHSSVTRKGKYSRADGNSTLRRSGSGRKDRYDDDIEADEREQDSSDSEDSQAIEEEVERVTATHNYETFFVEMLKLMASRGDINELIRGQEDSREGHDTQD